MPNPFIIAEIYGDLRVELKDSDLPFGRDREVTAFEMGGKVEVPDDGIKIPGRRGKVFQVLHTDDHRPLVLKGAFRDAQWGIAGHARNMRDQLEALRFRCNPLKLTWGAEQWTGIVSEFMFNVESPGSIAYELHFFIAESPSNFNTPVKEANHAPSSDVTDAIAAQLKTMRAEMLAQQWPTAILDDVLQLTTDMESLSLGIDLVVNEVASAPAHFAARVRNFLNAAGQVIQSIRNIKKAAELVLPIDLALHGQFAATPTFDAITQFWALQFSIQAQMTAMQVAMRTLSQTGYNLLYNSTTLYLVRDEDTLESIAHAQLGNRARASEIGLRQDQLVPGRMVRIPRGVKS